MFNHTKIVSPVILLSIFSALFTFAVFAAEKSRQSEVTTAEEVNWGYLNPLRGDQSPGAADLWGDRTKYIATGMLVRFKKGFSSPPHIHNISYRGIVIKGAMHNDDPTAEHMWMPTASYWTQPAGENHITAANDRSNMIYLEIDSGPYLVKPSDQHFDNGERPVNIHTSNLIWLKSQDSSLIDGDNIQISYLWKKEGSASLTNSTPLQGLMLKVTAGTKLTIDSESEEFRAVVIQGSSSYQSAETTSVTNLNPGSYFSSTGQFTHQLITREDTIFYIRSNGLFIARTLKRTR
ncbi:DUF4437 domain-containing protein [Catenovulum sediminis]|uniref:DUF4437 domain-containing protein n=1 Tax=Catenovulum sediminis TaxID=1740262 RepID=UPI00117C885D|nr:DUF4437 domain-containing protein [Catenovulum sediminis]